MIRYKQRIKFNSKLIQKLAKVTGSDIIAIKRNVEEILEIIGDLKENELTFHSWGVSDKSDQEASRKGEIQGKTHVRRGE